MATGSIGGAAKLLNVTAPGIGSPGQIPREVARDPLLSAPERARYPGAVQHRVLLCVINGWSYKKTDDLTEIISKIVRGYLSEMQIGCGAKKFPGHGAARDRAAGGATLLCGFDVSILNIGASIDH